VAPPSPTQLAWRGRIEAVLRLVGPGLDLVLATGDRVSRLVDRGDDDPVPPAVPLTTAAPQRAVTARAPTGGRTGGHGAGP
jgi:hypothetical protein